jgi:hypothetical protein
MTGVNHEMVQSPLAIIEQEVIHFPDLTVGSHDMISMKILHTTQHSQFSSFP